jgi:hypothetical protein
MNQARHSTLTISLPTGTHPLAKFEFSHPNSAVWLPLCGNFLSSPPSDPKAREKEYRRLSEELMVKIVLKADNIEPGEDRIARKARKELASEATAMMKELDAAYKRAADGKQAEQMSTKGDASRQMPLVEEADSRARSLPTSLRRDDGGQVKEPVSRLEQIQEQSLAEDHPDRLASQHELARAHQANGQVKEAVSLLEVVVRIRERTLAEDHPDRLAS